MQTSCRACMHVCVRVVYIRKQVSGRISADNYAN